MPEHIAHTPNRAPSATGFLLDPNRPILAYGRTMQPQDGIAPHHHPRAQLLWAMQGVLRIRSAATTWVVPPSHAVWIQGGVPHDVQSDTETTVRNLYIDPSLLLRTATSRCAVLALTALMRALIQRLYGEDTSTTFPPRLLRLWSDPAPVGRRNRHLP